MFGAGVFGCTGLTGGGDDGCPAAGGETGGIGGGDGFGAAVSAGPGACGGGGGGTIPGLASANRAAARSAIDSPSACGVFSMTRSTVLAPFGSLAIAKHASDNGERF